MSETIPTPSEPVVAVAVEPAPVVVPEPAPLPVAPVDLTPNEGPELTLDAVFNRYQVDALRAWVSDILGRPV